MAAQTARRQFGKLLREVRASHGPVVVERHGEPVVAVVPIELYERWKHQRDGFFERMRQAAERSGIQAEQEAVDLALDAQRWARTHR